MQSLEAASKWKVALLTYDAPHLKTQQVLASLALQSTLQVRLYALPFHQRPARTPRFRHRPNMWTAGRPDCVARHYNFEFRRIDSVDAIDEPFDVALIGGAGLLPAPFVSSHTVVNCHGGLIPLVRGLDAFKWAIHDLQPLANTLHIVDADVDAGRPLKVLRTPVYKDDCLETLAQRHYESEIQLLQRYSYFMTNPEPIDEGLTERAPRKRMPASIEAEMMSRFTQYAERYAVPEPRY